MKKNYFFTFLVLWNSFTLYGNRITHQARMAQDRSYAPHSFKKKQPITVAQATIPPKKIKRKGLQGYKHTVPFSRMDYAQLANAKEGHKKAKNWDIVIKYLDRMIIMCENEGETSLKEKANLIIEVADILFEQQHYDDATKRYTEFTQAHAGDMRVEYALYKAIVCASQKILSSDRDQSATEKTLELADSFLKQGDTFKKYRTEVQKIQRHCYHVLAASDCNVAQFYITYGNYQAAEKRLTSIRTEWIEKAPDITTQLANLEVELSLVSPTFKAPNTSFKLAAAKQPEKKVDMTRRF